MEKRRRKKTGEDVVLVDVNGHTYTYTNVTVREAGSFLCITDEEVVEYVPLCQVLSVYFGAKAEEVGGIKL